MTEYQTPMDVWIALSKAEKGAERAAILKHRSARNLVLNSGSFVIFSTGDVYLDGQTFAGKLSNIRLLQTQRIRPKDGADDGKGTFGGMSERTSDKKFASLRGKGILNVDIAKDVFGKDDLTLSAGGDIQKTFDLGAIARITAARESMEEFMELTAITDIYKKLGIEKDGLRFSFSVAALTPIPLTNVRDDNYITNIWSGDLDYQAYAITPFGHLASLEKDVFESIVSIANTDKKAPEIGQEIAYLTSVSLFDALKQWGKRGADGMRDLSHDYRYPHEWMGVWRKAQIVLGLHCGGGAGMGAREVGMVNLMTELQHAVVNDAEQKGVRPHMIDMIGALTEMNGGKILDLSELEKFEEDFDLPHLTFHHMQEEAKQVMKDRGYAPKVQKSHTQSLVQ